MELITFLVYFADGLIKTYQFSANDVSFGILNNTLRLSHYWSEDINNEDKYILKNLYDSEWKGQDIIKVTAELQSSEFSVKDINLIDFTMVYEVIECDPRETVRFQHIEEE